MIDNHLLKSWCLASYSYAGKPTRLLAIWLDGNNLKSRTSRRGNVDIAQNAELSRDHGGETRGIACTLGPWDSNPGIIFVVFVVRLLITLRSAYRLYYATRASFIAWDYPLSLRQTTQTHSRAMHYACTNIATDRRRCSIRLHYIPFFLFKTVRLQWKLNLWHE